MEPLHFLKHSLTSYLRKSTRIRNVYKAPHGYTVLEMIVVLAIVGILTAVILVGQTTFNRTLLLTDTAYTVALSIRETQTLGLSSEKTLGVQNAAFGVHFAVSPSNSYVQFADVLPTITAPSWCPPIPIGTPASLIKPGNCVYDGAGELYHTFNFNQGFVQSFCIYTQVNGSPTPDGCSNGAPYLPNLSSLDIVFQRPNTTTLITGTLTSGVYAAQPDTACIEIKAPTGTCKFVQITQLGQISVTPTCGEQTSC